jgi:hypothetical protein
MKSFVCSFIALLVSLTASMLVSSDVIAADRLTSRLTSTDVRVGSEIFAPARDDTTVFWLDKNMARRDDPGEQSVIYDRKKNWVYVLYHKFDLYTIFDLDGAEVTDTSANASTNTGVSFEEGLRMLEQPSGDVSVSPTDSTIKICGFLCHQYLMSDSASLGDMMGGSHNEIWATEELKIDKEMYDIIRKAAKTAAGVVPGQAGQELSKVRGITMRYESQKHGTVTGFGSLSMKVSEELIDIREIDPPPGCFEVPADYKWYRNGNVE